MNQFHTIDSATSSTGTTTPTLECPEVVLQPEINDSTNEIFICACG